jgi:hypothetical protein
MPIKSVFFGLSPDSYDSGRRPSCAINAGNVVVEVHKGESENTLNWRIGKVEGVKLSWLLRPSGYQSFGNGTNPAVAINRSNIVIVVYNDDRGLHYRIGKVSGANLNFSAPQSDFGDTASSQPSVAVNEAGIVVEVHHSGSGIFWRRGRLKGQTLNWRTEQTALAATGSRPFVAINNRGRAVAVFEGGGNDHQLFYSIGTFDPANAAPKAAITWTAPVSYDTGGARPSIALTDDGHVYETHQSASVGDQNTPLYQRVGIVENNAITWQDFLSSDTPTYRYKYDIGRQPQVAANNEVAIQVHRTDDKSGTSLFANASLIFDRANWMGDNRGKLVSKKLKELALPASHDAGAFGDNPAKTQDLTIRSQLAYGVRYFDLRPIYTGELDDSNPDPEKFFTYHDVFVFGETTLTNFPGPLLTTVISRVRSFMQTHKELVILKISHYKNFNQKIFDTLVGLITGADHLGPWLFKPSDLGTGQRLAEQTTDKYLKTDEGSVLIVADIDGSDGSHDYVTTHRTNGIFRYRDWYAPDPQNGDLTVFDLFTDTTDFQEMATFTQDDKEHANLPQSDKKVPRGQLPKFNWFDGKCQGSGNMRSNVVCDLFLLSWTLTPLTPEIGVGTAFVLSARANRNLVDYLARPDYRGKNPNDLSMNLLYTDAVEFSRSVDVALVRNGLV